MEQQPAVNTGSFGAVIGGMSDALQQVMQQRKSGQYVPPSSQVSNTAPTVNNTPQPIPTAPPTAAAQAGQQMAGGQPPGQPLPFDSAESKMIIGALTNRLKAGSQYHASR